MCRNREVVTGLLFKTVTVSFSLFLFSDLFVDQLIFYCFLFALIPMLFLCY